MELPGKVVSEGEEWEYFLDLQWSSEVIASLKIL